MNKATHNDSWVQNPDGTLGYTCSLITGCQLEHDYCFAKKLANGRLRERYLHNVNIPQLWQNKSLSENSLYLDNPFWPRFWPDHLEKLDHFLAKSKKPLGIFLNIMGEWAGGWIPKPWHDFMFELINRHPGHRFYLLTHCPQSLPRFSPFPGHCYVGVTATDPKAFYEATKVLADIEATIRFISVEPYLAGSINFPPWVGKFLDWLIIGACTGAKMEMPELARKYPGLTPMPYGKRWTAQPKIQWVEEVIGAADQAGIPIFIKDNLKPLLRPYYEGLVMLGAIKNKSVLNFVYNFDQLHKEDFKLRQEMPG